MQISMEFWNCDYGKGTLRHFTTMSCSDPAIITWGIIASVMGAMYIVLAVFGLFWYV